jgi:hypothetical protein
MAVYLLGSVAQATALSLVPLLIVAPLSALSIPASNIFAPWYLQESESWFSVASGLMILIGAVVVIAFGPRDRQVPVEPKQLYEFLDRDTWLWFMGVALVTLILLGGFALVVERRLSFRRPLRLSFPSSPVSSRELTADTRVLDTTTWAGPFTCSKLLATTPLASRERRFLKVALIVTIPLVCGQISGWLFLVSWF